ncbi:hypothetical protein M569_07032, partial [Genlisea aurea]
GMPAQKRPRDSTASPPSPYPPLDVDNPDDSLQGYQNHEQQKPGNSSESEGTSSSGDGEKQEYITVKLAEVRKEVQCPICLGIIRKTRTVMECLHRFCRECIDKSMRLGNNECPACRTHCASRRSLRDDPNYDTLIATLYPDIDKYEEEELIFHEEEKARNEKIQALIAQTFRRQAEALGKKRTPLRYTTPATFSRRTNNYRKTRGRRNHRAVDANESDEDEGSKDSSSGDEHSIEGRGSERPKRWGGASRALKQSADDENELELSRDEAGAASASPKVTHWGKGGMRTNNRHRGHTWTDGKISRQNRISKLINRLQSSRQNDAMAKLSLKLISLDEEKIPSLKRPYLCCTATSSIRNLIQYVSMQTCVECSEIEMVMVKDSERVNVSQIFKEEPVVDHVTMNNNELHHPVNQHETLDEIRAKFALTSL